MRILSIDPGATTGMAFYRTPWGIDSGTRKIPAMMTEIPPGDACERIYGKIQEDEGAEISDRLVIAWETWRPRPGVKSHQPAALEVIGFARHICGIHQVDFLEVPPGVAKRMFPEDNKRLRKVVNLVPRMEHSWDAARVLLAALHMEAPEILRAVEGRDVKHELGTSTAGNRVQL